MTKTVEFEGEQHFFPDDTTDEEINAALSGQKTSPQKPIAEGTREVPSTLSYEIPAVMSAINEDSIASALGLPVDAVSASLRFVGAPTSEMPVGGSDWLRSVMRSTGASSKQRPETITGKAVAAAGGGAAEAVLSGAGTGTLVKKAGEKLAKPALEKVGELLRNVRGNVAAGAGGGVGGEIGHEAGKGTPLDKPLTVAGEFVGGGVAGAVEPSVRFRPRVAAVPDAVISSYERLKLAPSAAERGIGGRAIEWLQGNILPQTIGGGNVMETFRQKRMQDLHNLQMGIADAYGGIRQREGMGSGIKQDVMDTWTQIKQKDGEIIGGIRSKYGAENTYANEFVGAVANPVGGATTQAVREATLDPLMGQAAAMIQQTAGNFTIDDLAQLKTLYGAAMEPGFQKNINDAQVAQLFKAVSNDIENFIRDRSPQEYRALKDANDRYAAAQNDFRAHFKKLLGTGDVPVSGERAYEIMAGSATEKGKADLQEFRQVWDAMAPRTRGDLSATILGRMGATDKSDVTNWQTWQLGKFLSEYRNLSTEAKDMLFGGKPDVAQSLDDLVKVGANMQERMLKLASSSRSGTGALVLGQFGLGGIINHFTKGGWDMIGSVLWGVGGPWVAAQVLTDPRLVRALARSTQKFSDGIDGAARAAIDLSVFPKAGRQAIIPQQIIDKTPSPPISQ